MTVICCDSVCQSKQFGFWGAAQPSLPRSHPTRLQAHAGAYAWNLASIPYAVIHSKEGMIAMFALRTPKQTRWNGLGLGRSEPRVRALASPSEPRPSPRHAGELRAPAPPTIIGCGRCGCRPAHASPSLGLQATRLRYRMLFGSHTP
eukprot:359365-Chlamydomonas_euryale.AAC.14